MLNSAKMSNAALAPPRVAIIGGGISGLICGNRLKQLVSFRSWQMPGSSNKPWDTMPHTIAFETRSQLDDISSIKCRTSTTRFVPGPNVCKLIGNAQRDLGPSHTHPSSENFQQNFCVSQQCHAMRLKSRIIKQCRNSTNQYKIFLKLCREDRLTKGTSTATVRTATLLIVSSHRKHISLQLQSCQN